MPGETGMRFHEGNFNFILLGMLDAIKEEDRQVFKDKLNTGSQESFDKLIEDEQNICVMLDQLTDEEFAFVNNAKNVSYFGGLHDFRNKILAYMLLSGRKIKK